MLTSLFIFLVLSVLEIIPTIIISVNPALSVDKLPFGIDDVMVQGMGYVHFLSTLFPPIGVMLSAVLFVIGFKIFLKIIAMIPIIRGILYK